MTVRMELGEMFADCPLAWQSFVIHTQKCLGYRSTHSGLSNKEIQKDLNNLKQNSPITVLTVVERLTSLAKHTITCLYSNMEKNMSSVDKMINKALSTFSEEEAIAVLRMARKHYNKDEYTAARTDANTGDSVFLYEEMLARLDYTVAQQDIDIAGLTQLYTYANKLVQRWQIATGVVAIVGIIGWLI